MLGVRPNIQWFFPSCTVPQDLSELHIHVILCMFTEPEQWTQIQAPLKFYKLIVDELRNLYQNTTDDVEEGSDEVSDLMNIVQYDSQV